MNDWRTSSGVSESTDKVQVYTAQKLKDQWQEEAEEQGLSLSKYVIKLVQEARVYRSEGVLRDEGEQELVTELQQENERLQQQLENQGSTPSADIQFDAATLKQEILTGNYQTLEDILQKVVEGGALDSLLRQPVENELYYLAAQDEVEYERGWGWKLTEQRGEQ